jgi:RimJ/RimL family protein N-acetyltransferase
MILNGNVIIKNASLDEVRDFLGNAGSSLDSFRYFDKRPLEIIENHIVTLVAMIDEQVVGYGHLDPENNIIWLGICVVPSFQGKRIGRRIMKELLKKAHALSVKEIALSVDIDNKAAIQLYENFGFVISKNKGNVIFMKLPL